MKIRSFSRRHSLRLAAMVASLFTLAAASPGLAGIANPDFEDPKAGGWKMNPQKPPDGAVAPRVEKQANGNHVAVIGADAKNPGADGASILQTFDCGNGSPASCVITFEYGFSVPKGTVERAYIQVSNAKSTVTKQMAPGAMGPHTITIPGCSPQTTIQFWIENDPKDPAGTQSQLTLDNFKNECRYVSISESALTDPDPKIFQGPPTPPEEEVGPLVDAGAPGEIPPPGNTNAVAVVTLQPGATLIANSFSRGSNTLDEVLSQVAVNSMLFKLNPTNNYYDSYLRMPEGWQPPGATLLPGEAAFLMVQQPRTLVLEGDVVPAGPRPRPSAGTYLLGGFGPLPLSLEEAIGFPLEVGDRISLFDAATPAMPPEPTQVILWPPADPTLLPSLQPGHGLMIEVSDEVTSSPPPPPFPLSVEREGELLHFSWPVTDEPLQLLATASLTEPVWHSLNVPTTVAEGFVHAYLNPAIFIGPVCLAVGKADCACKNLTLKSVGFDKNGASYDSVNGGKTEVILNFGVKGMLTCDKDSKAGVCRGKIHWELVAPSIWAAQSTDTSRSGDKIVTAPCDGKAHEVVANNFTFKTVVSAGRPVRGTAKIKLTTECPIGTVKDTRTISIVFDSTSNGDPKGIDRGASDLDGDGLTGDEEAKKGTKDDDYDTDGDGKNDGVDNFPTDPKRN